MFIGDFSDIEYVWSAAFYLDDQSKICPEAATTNS